MSTYKVTDPQTGKTIRLTGDTPPTEQELNNIFASIHEQEQPSQPVQQQADIPIISDIKNNVTKRVNEIKNAPYTARNPVEAGFQMTGNEIGLLGDIVGPVIGKGYEVLGRLASNPASKMVPIAGGVFNTIDAANKLVPLIAKSQPVQNAKGVYDKLDPNTRKDIGAAVNITSLYPIGKGGQIVGREIKAATDAMPQSVKQAAKKIVTDESGMVALAPAKYDIKTSQIPDIDELAKTIDTEPPKQIENAKKGIRNPQITTAEANLLKLPESETVKPFDKVIKDAQYAKDHELEGVLTPLDKAASDKGNAALKVLESKRQEIGKLKGELIDKADDYLIATNQFADATPIQQNFNQILRDKMGAQINEKGQIVDAAGQIMKDSSDRLLIQKMYRTVNKLGKETTLKEIDGAIQDLRNLVEHKKVQQVKQMNTIAEGIGKELRSNLQDLRMNYLENAVDWGGANQFLGENGVATLKKSLTDYANISKIEERFNRALGEVVDEKTGQPRMGASLLKSSMSNSDRGSKALFRAIKDQTGYDLQREAANAIVAMDAVGDVRAANLLKEAGIARSVLTGNKAEMLLRLGQKGTEIFTGDKKKQLLRYYNKNNTQSQMQRLGDLRKVK